MFHVNLYKEGLRRSLLPAALFIAVMLAAAILIPVGQIQSNLSAIADGRNPGITLISGFASNYLLIMAMVAMAPSLTMSQFSFLNRRADSDFFHSLPHKRECVLISFTAATVTWLLLGIWVSTAVSVAIYSVAAQFFVLSLSSILLTSLGVSVASVLVVAVVLVAMSVTGSKLSNFITAGLILFLPRMIMLVFTEIVMMMTRVLLPESLGILGQGGNIPFNAMFGNILGRYTAEDISIFVSGTLYSFVLALIYFILAIILFKRRKSETAGTPCQSGLVHTIIRVAVAFFVCLLAMVVIFDGILHEGSSLSSERLFYLGVIYLGAVAVYFGYELITTKKISNLKRSAWGLVALALLNVAFIAGVFVVQDVVQNRTLSTDDIRAMQIRRLGTQVWQSERTYESLRTHELAIEDEALIALLIEGLEAFHVEPQWHRYHGSRSNQVVVAFERTQGRTIYRQFWIDFTHMHAVNERLDQLPEYREAFLAPPENPEHIQSWGADLPEAAWREIYEVFREESMALSMVEAQQIRDIIQGMETGFLPIYTEFSVRGFIEGGQEYTSRYMITSLTPRAAELLVAHVNATFANEVLRALRYDGNVSWIDVMSMDEGNLWVDVAHDDFALLQLLSEAVEAQGTDPMDADKPRFMIHFNSIDSEGRNVHGTVFFHSDNEELLERFG